MSSGDEYVRVDFVLREVREKAFMITRSRSEGLWTNIPRSVVHGGDDMMLGLLKYQVPIDVQRVRIFAWKARELGL